MARASFTLRKESPSYSGSYLQYPPSYDATASVTFPLRDDGDDIYLKADSLQIAPILQDVIPGGNEYASASFFQVDCVDYTQVRISWGVSLTDTLTLTPQADQVVIAYSSQGEPDAINEGVVLIETNTARLYNHTVTPGKWAYYTLFLRYQSLAGDLYYEPVAKLSVLVPNNYGSTGELYAKIPVYYRLADGDLDEGQGGPLYRYLSVIGWDIDRFRTLIDYLLRCKDPQMVRSQELDVLVQDLGLDLYSQQIGSARLRALVDIVGTIRRNNGTPSAIQSALIAITGSDVVVDQQNLLIKVRPQRVNFIKDPKFILGTSSSLDGGLPNAVFNSVIDGGNSPTPGTPTVTYDGGLPTDVFTDGTGRSWAVVSDTVINTVGADVPITAGDVFYFSMHSDGQNYVTEVALENTSGSPRTVICSDNTAYEIGGRKYWKLEVPAEYSGAATAGFRVSHSVSSSSSPDDVLKYMLLERNNIGDYFDGSSRRGGWLGNPDGTGVSDFQWSESPNASYSYYNANFQKTKYSIARIIGSLLPVNQLVTSGTVYSNRPIVTNYYTIQYNVLV